MARLLPFTAILSSPEKGRRTCTTEAEDVLLTVLSELPPDVFLADLLAFCFPLESSGERNLDTKLGRLLARLRSAPLVSTTDGPRTDKPNKKKRSAAKHATLSVRYQVKSRKISVDQSASEINHKFQPLTTRKYSAPKELTADDLCLKGVDLKVGSYLFEYDKEYLKFLDTVFAVMLSNNDRNFPHSSVSANVSSTKGRQSSTSKLHVPLLTAHYGTISHGGKKNLGKQVCAESESCWEAVAPLLSILDEWSKARDPTQHGLPSLATRQQQQDYYLRPPPSSSSSSSSSKSSKRGRRRSRQGRGNRSSDVDGDGDCTAMRVELSATFLLHCLQEEEARLSLKASKSEATMCSRKNASPGPQTPHPSVNSGGTCSGISEPSSSTHPKETSDTMSQQEAATGHLQKTSSLNLQDIRKEGEGEGEELSQNSSTKRVSSKDHLVTSQTSSHDHREKKKTEDKAVEKPVASLGKSFTDTKEDTNSVSERDHPKPPPSTGELVPDTRATQSLMLASDGSGLGFTRDVHLTETEVQSSSVLQGEFPLLWVPDTTLQVQALHVCVYSMTTHVK